MERRLDDDERPPAVLAEPGARLGGGLTVLRGDHGHEGAQRGWIGVYARAQKPHPEEQHSDDCDLRLARHRGHPTAKPGRCYRSDVRSPISLAILFLALATLSVAGLPGVKLAPTAYPLVGLLGCAGLLVLTRLRAGYYLGLVAGGVTAISGVIAWASPTVGARYALPIHPGISMVVGLYLCFRIAIAHRMFGPQPDKRARLNHERDEA